MKTINETDVRRWGNHIRLGQNRTATEGRDELNRITIRENGKVISRARGSSLCFSDNLTDEDKRYLAALGSDAK